MPVRQSRTSARTTAFGSGLGRARGIRRQSDRGRVGDRVAAGDPRRVLGREDREAERRAARPAPRRRSGRRPAASRGGVGVTVAAAAAAAPDSAGRAASKSPENARPPRVVGSTRQACVRATISRSLHWLADHRSKRRHPPSGPYVLDIRPRLPISCRAKPNSRLVAGGRGTQAVGASRAMVRETQALSASARQLTPQADERGIRLVLPAGIRPCVSHL